MFITIVSFFIVLIVLIVAHELGHFVTAKLSGVKVEEFGIFLPPRIWGKKIGETIYSINAIPLGGFNKLSGEEDPKVERSLAGKSIPVRLLVLGAGSLMNLLLPLVLLSIAFMVPHLEAINTVVVEEVAPDSPASQAGILPGDTILSINDVPLTTVDEYSNTISQNLGKQVTVKFEGTDGTVKEATLTPRVSPPPGQGATGVALAQGTTRKSLPFWEAIPKGAARYWDVLALLVDGIRQTVRGTVPFEVTGPVGIAQIVGEVARTGISNLLQLAAFISVNLGIVNIFPIPGLDGGRIVFVLLEWVRRGKRVSAQTERLVHAIGFVLLMALIILVTYRDILRLIRGQTPLG